MQVIKLSIMVVLFGFFASGCATTARIEAKGMARSQGASEIELSVLDKATDARKSKSDQVGRHTISVVMIPGPGVFSGGGHVTDMVGELGIRSLQDAGYTVNVVSDVTESRGPTVAFQLDLLRNYSFTWLYPLGLTFGQTQITPILFDNGGNILWTTTVTGDGFSASLFYIDGFSSAIRAEMTEVFRKALLAMESDEFRAALSSQ